LYRLLPWKYGRLLLVLASYFFYGFAHPWYCLLLFASTITDFYVAQYMEQTTKKSRRRSLLLLSVFTNIGLLSVFKYSNFFIENINFILGSHFPLLNIILPVGISFYTFQTLAYTIDVYRKNTPAEKDFWTFSLYVAYFPQLVAGPIERARNLIPQLSKKLEVSDKMFMRGIERILWGLIKKTVFADRIAVFVNAVYSNPEAYGTEVIILAMFAFMMQLYLDFSAYTDIAIGIARLMGVRLNENFRWPFAARNPTDFWNRWNRTLTTWFMDYVFRPLGGIQRKKPLRTAFNSIVVFTATGFWHGANWNFILFGLFAGLYIAAYQYLRLFRKRKNTGPLLGKTLGGKIADIALHSLTIYSTGVFFRTPDMHTAGQMFAGVFRSTETDISGFTPYFWLIPAVFAWHYLRAWYMPLWHSGKIKLPHNETLFSILFFLIILVFGYEYRETFIYFQF
jgi:D-alanyl-lipoteichoic acid acyltransferase DltB (MBOAT superfamily)